MSTKIASYIKFKTQDGFEDQFLQSAVAFNKKIMTDVEWHITKIDEGILCVPTFTQTSTKSYMSKTQH